MRPPAEAGEEGAGDEVDGEGGSKYRTAYYIFTDDFTSNLKNSVGLIQVSIAASTHRDGRVLMWLKKHELACRSEILTVLSDTPEEEVLTPEGKERLQKRIDRRRSTRCLTERRRLRRRRQRLFPEPADPMRPEGIFVAERLAAQHCAELLRAPRQAAIRWRSWPQFGGQLADGARRAAGRSIVPGCEDRGGSGRAARPAGQYRA